MTSVVRILHVDADQEFRDSLAEFLEAADERFEVLTGRDAGTGLDRLAENSGIDCLLSEFDLPDMNGIEFFRAVQSRFPEGSVPFVLVTDAGSERVAAEALNAGASGYVDKSDPDAHERVLERVRRVLGDRRVDDSGRFDALAGALDDPVYVLDADGQFTYVNDAFVDLVGYDRDEMLGSTPSLIKDEEAVATAERNLGRILSADGPDSVTFEVDIQPEDGEAVPCEDHMGVLPYEGEQFVGSLGVLRNIAERKAHERKLRWYEGILETTGNTAAVYDEEGHFKLANGRLADLYDTTPSDLRGESSALVAALRNQNGESDPFEDLVEGRREEVRTELELDVPGTEDRVTDAWLSRITDDGELVGIAAVGRDVTDRKRRERELERSREFLEHIQEVADVGGWEVDARSDTLRWTDEVYRIHGLPLEYEPTVEEAVDFYHPEDRPRLEDAFDRLVGEGEPYDLELRIVTADDEERWVRTRGTPWYEDGTVVGARGTIQDITERIEYEQRLETQRDNLDLLNQMVRHDIRNDLQVVTAYAEFLEEHTDGREREYAEKILSRAENAIELTQSARDLAEVMRQPDRDLEPVGLGHVLESELDEIRRSATNAAITVEGSIPHVTVRASDMLSSVFRNLLKNAIQHNDKDVPEVTVSVTERGDTVEVAVADNGPGVPDDRKEEIFGKGEKGLESAGTGIGLYLVRTLVEMYHGDVRVDDNDPEGAVFVVELPTV